MSSLHNSGVLVTRPAHQAGDLIRAIEEAGGRVLPFPVIDIRGRAAQDIQSDELALPKADIVIFVSSNAVAHGMDAIGASQARLAAVGPATKRAIESAGHVVDIFPSGGYDSEHLLESPGLQDVSGTTIRIVRGGSGRDLLAESLRERGAQVDYLETYRRCAQEFSAAELSQLERAWMNREIQFVVAMSVDSLLFFLAALPDPCHASLTEVSLVTPSERVIQTAMERVPEMHSVLAAGPGTIDMLEAVIASLQQAAGAAK